MRTNPNTIDSLRKLRVRRSGSTLPDLTHLINEDEAEALGVTQAWKAAVVESKTRAVLESGTAEDEKTPSNVTLSEETPSDATIAQPQTVPMVPAAEESAVAEPKTPENEPLPDDIEPETPERAAIEPATVAIPLTPTMLDEKSHDATPTAPVGETLKHFVTRPVVKKAAYYSAIVLGAMTFFFIVDPNGTSPVDVDAEADAIATQEPLHSEPLVEAAHPPEEEDVTPVSDEIPAWAEPAESIASETTTVTETPTDSSLLEDLGAPDDSQELMSSLRSQTLAQTEQNHARPQETYQVAEESYEQLPVSDNRAEQQYDSQYNEFQTNDFVQEDDRSTYQPPSQGLPDNRHEPVLNAPLTEVSPSQSVYEETRPENFAFPVDAIPKAISLLRNNRRLR